MQAAKRTPVDLQEWAISMMERHNRKSYLAPAAPLSLKENSAHPKPPPKPIASKPSRTPHATAGTGEIPLNIVNDSQQRNLHTSSKPSPQPPRSTLSPPSLSLEHLSLETKEEDPRQGRISSRSPRGDPLSAVDAPTRPLIGTRSASSNNTNSRTTLQTTTLLGRTANSPSAPPPPSGPPPAPPKSAWQFPGSHMRSENVTRRTP